MGPRGGPRNDDRDNIRGPPRNDDRDNLRGPPRGGDRRGDSRDGERRDGPPRRFIGKPKNDDAGNDGGNWRGAPRQERRNPEPVAAVNQTQPEKQEQAAPPVKNQEEEVDDGWTKV